MRIQQQSEAARTPRMREIRWPVWSGSVKDEVEFRPTPKQQVRDCFQALLLFESQTKKPGHQNGAVGRSGIEVFRALAYSFHNWTTGQMTPSIKMIAIAANISERSVYRGLAALKACGALDWIRRCIGVAVDGIFRLKQISSAYFFKAKSFVAGLRRPAECPEPLPEEVGLAPPPLDPPPPDAAEMAAAARTPAENIAALESERNNDLFSATARLGRMIFGARGAADPVQLGDDAARLMAGMDARNAGKA